MKTVVVEKFCFYFDSPEDLEEYISGHLFKGHELITQIKMDSGRYSMDIQFIWKVA